MIQLRVGALNIDDFQGLRCIIVDYVPDIEKIDDAILCEENIYISGSRRHP